MKSEIDLAIERLDSFLCRIVEAMKAIADRQGMLCELDGRLGSTSRYVDICAIDEDGFAGERVAQARVSNHKQSFGGPDWSFEWDDSDESIERGLKQIESIVVKWKTL